MKISRRGFVHAGCVAGAVSLAPNFLDRAEARPLRGGGSSAPPPPSPFNLNRASLNVPPGGTGLMNLAKTWSPTSNTNQPLSPSLIDSNGYPNTTLPVNYSGGIGFDQNYYGKYVIQYTGPGSLNLLQCAIIYSGGTSVTSLISSGGVGQGYVTANFQPLNTADVSSGIVFKFGGLVASVSGGNNVSPVTITTVAALNFVGISPGTNVSFNQGCSANLVNGPNFDGSWTIASSTSTTFTLANSTGVVSPTVTGSGGVGTQTEAIITNNSMQYNSGFAFSSFTNLVVCKQGDLADINNGLHYSSILVSQLQQLRGTPGGVGRAGQSWLRFMDVSGQAPGAGGSFECDFSQRLTPTTQCWVSQSNYRQGYMTPSTNSVITNGGSDNYTCADPSVSTLSGGVLIDNAIVQGTASASNTGGNPTAAVGSGPAKPIFGAGNNWTSILRIVSLPTSPGTDVLHFSFQAAWLNSNTPVAVSYTTQANDTTISNLSANLNAFFNGSAGAALTNAKIFFNNANGGVGPTLTAPTAQAGRLTVTYTSGTASIIPSTVVPGEIVTGTIITLVYNYLMDGWLYLPQGMNCSQPLESIVELCNRVGANLWYNIGTTKGAYITAVYGLFGNPTTGLTSDLRAGLEGWNEIWNPGAFPHGLLQVLGRGFGWADSANQSDGGYTGLRTLQYCALASAAWTGQGRNASDFYMMQMSQLGNPAGSGFDVFQVQGQQLVTSNTFYANFGGLNGGTAPDHSIAPNRPVDFPAIFIGLAPYWNSRYLGDGSFTAAASVPNPGPVGTVAQNVSTLQAAKDYSGGSTSTAFTAIVNQFNRVGTVGPNTGALDFVDMQTFFTQQEAIAAQFDAGRSIKVGINHYEGGPSFGIGSNGNSGVNSPDNQAASLQNADIMALAGRFSDLGWTTTQLIPFTTSGTGDLTEMATMVLVLLQGWKYDLNANGTAANTGSYKTMIPASYYQPLVNTSGANRETHPGQYGYNGSNWGFLWSSYNAPGVPYQNFNAMAEWNT